MKFWIKILFILILVFILIWTAAYLFLVYKGKPIIIGQLEKLTQKQVKMGSLDLSPSFDLKIKDLEIKDLAKVGSLSISPNFLGLLTGKIALNELKIYQPELTYVRQKETPAATDAGGGVSGTSLPAKTPLRLMIKRISIKDGRLNFIDRAEDKEIKIIVKDLYFMLNNLLVLSPSVITKFELKGNIPWQEGQTQGKIEAEGWLNLFKRDMQATLKIGDIDGIYLYPYYSKWVDLEKARIEKAKLNFTSYIQGLNNDVIAQCRLELTDIVRKPRPPEEEPKKAEMIADTVLDIFRALNQGKIVLDFTIKTKMDRPEFNFGNIKMAFEDKLQQGARTEKFNVEDILMFPAKLLEGTVKGATDISKAMIDGTVEVGKQIKRAVIDPLVKEKQEQKN